MKTVLIAFFKKKQKLSSLENLDTIAMKILSLKIWINDNFS